MEPPVANCRLIELEAMSDERGSLIALESDKQIPFPIKRIYYLFGTAAGAERGFHAHRTLRQWLICTSGACTVQLDDSERQCEILLNRPNLALEIGPLVWRELRNFTLGSVLMVLADS